MLAAIERNYDEQHPKQLELDNIDIEDNYYEKPERTRKIKFLSQISQISSASFFSVMSIEKALTESKEFFIQISPVDIIEWPEYRWYRKILECFKAIPYFVMTLCIPVVDLESPKENWCRLLTCVNVLFGPQMALFLLGRKLLYLSNYSMNNSII